MIFTGDGKSKQSVIKNAFYVALFNVKYQF